MLCLSGHQCCLDCVKSFILSLETNPLKCIESSCSSSINIKSLITFLSSDPFLIQIRDKLEFFGFYLNFCPSCSLKIDLGSSKDSICPHCNNKVCNYCKKIGHFGKTCFYFESELEFDVIELKPPKNVDNPQNLREIEFLNAKYAFEQFLEKSGARFEAVKLVVNKRLEDRYAEKKKLMAEQCGGEDKVGEVYIWHGSKKDLYQTIMEDGLKVGGVDGIPISQGKAHGYGVYCSTTPDSPMEYANDSKWILACLALKGKESPKKVRRIENLDTGEYHSYKPQGDIQKNWQVFFTKEQLLPRFLVKYSI